MRSLEIVSKVFWIARTKLVFGTAGYRSRVIRPLRVIGGKNITLGSQTIFLNGARIEAISEYAGKRYDPRISIGNNVFAGQNTHISGVNNIIIGNNVMISGNVFIGDSDHQYTDVTNAVMDQDIISNKTIIGDDSFLGYGSVIQAGAIVGKHCVIGSNAVVRGVLPGLFCHCRCSCKNC